jgi:exonuclease VII large subunit
MRMINANTRWFELRTNYISRLGLKLKHPKDIVKFADEKLVQAKSKLAKAMEIFLQSKLQSMHLSGSLLESYSYKKTLERGFAIFSDEKQNTITSSKSVKRGDRLNALFHDGNLTIIVD